MSTARATAFVERLLWGGGRRLIVPVVAALALAGAAPAEAAGAPRVGRWVGTSAQGTNLSFTIHAVGGRRYIANEVAVCGTSGFAHPLLDIPGSDSYGWPVDPRGRIRDLKSSIVAPVSPVKGRLGRTSGIVHGEIGSSTSGPGAVSCLPVRQSVRVRWVGAPVVESGRWEMTGQMDSHGRWWVIGGAALHEFSGVISTPRLPPHAPFEDTTCGAALAVYEDAWIEPDGSFAADDDLPDNGRLDGRFGGTAARGTYWYGGPYPDCDRTPFPFTARLVERQPPPRVGQLVLPPPVPGGGSQPPSGPCGRPSTVTVNPVKAISCFRDRGGLKVSSATVRLNGIDVVPARGTEVRLDPRTAHLTTTGPAEVRVPVGPYGTTDGLRVWRGRLDRHLRTFKGFKVRSLGPKPDTTRPPAIDERAIGGLPITGSAEFTFEPGSARGKVSVELPRWLGGITADAALRTTNDAGLDVEQIKLTFPGTLVGGLGLKGASLALGQSATGAIHWDGSATVELQRDKKFWERFVDLRPLELKVELGFGTGDGYFRLAGSVDGLNKRLFYRGIYLQRLGLSGQRNPWKFGGNIGYSAGPQIDVAGVGKLEAVSLDGTYELQLGSPLCFQQTAKGRVVTAELVSSRHRMCSNGLLEGEFGLRSTPLPRFAVTGRLTGWVFQDRAFNLEGTARISVPGPDGLGEVVVSSEGIAACLAGTRVGFGRRWRDGRVHVMARSCGIGPWRADKPATARAAQQQALQVRPGQRVAVFSATGKTAAPTVTLLGPRGERLRAGPTGVVDHRIVAFQDPAARAAYFAVARPSPGRWRLQVEPGSAPVTAFRTAAPRPRVRIRARVTAAKTGARRLRYRIAGLGGGRVRFFEHAEGVRRVIGATRRSRGVLRFRPAPSTAARRRIVATVVRDGAPEPARRIARFRARTGRAAPPRRVRIRARGVRRVIAWSGPRDRAYRVSVRISDGRRLLFLPGRRHRVTVRPVLGGTRLRATVRALDRLGRPGAARTAWSPPKRKPTHRAPARCAAALARAGC